MLGVRFLGPVALGLSPGLAERLATWLARWERVSGYWINEWGKPDWLPAEESALRRDLLDLGHDVAHELGPDVEVLIEGIPLDEYRRGR
ncbi:hypothetical protein A7K94_0203560 [Modestobacter sp. VKM Ac-2676]|nr:hypothetical protein A7K94_0203560 [Modestobacter sp. VKM Ac-2676]